MKLRIVNEFGTPLSLKGATLIKVQFEYENGHTLEKTNPKILDAAEGKIQVDLDEFEIQGLKVGDAQNFLAEVQIDDDIYHVLFAKSLNVRIKDGRKAIVL